jgi:hypothetical protein
MPASDRHHLIEQMLSRYRQILERRLALGPQKIDQIEQTVEEISQELEHELDQRILEQQKTRPDNRAGCPRYGATAYVVTPLAAFSISAATALGCDT